MKTLLTRYSVLALMFAMLGLASCTEEDGIVTPPDETGGTIGARNLSATALSSTSISLRWQRDSAYSGIDTVIYTPSTGGTSLRVTGSSMSDTDAVLTGLTANTIYNIVVRGHGDTAAPSIQWAPARRWPFESSGQQTVRIYSTSAPLPTQPSGLVIGPSDIHAASTEGSEATDIDLVFAYDDAVQKVFLQSPTTIGSGIPANIANETKFALPFYVDGGLDQDFYTGSVASLVPTTSPINAIEVEALASSDEGYGLPLIAIFLTEDNHFGRVEIVPQSNNLLYGTATEGSVTYDFIDVRVSYQTLTNTGFVSRPRTPRSEHAPRVVGKATVRNIRNN